MAEYECLDYENDRLPLPPPPPGPTPKKPIQHPRGGKRAVSPLSPGPPPPPISKKPITKKNSEDHPIVQPRKSSYSSPTGTLTSVSDGNNARGFSPIPSVSKLNTIDGETLLLPDLVRKYSKSLPLRVRVEEGFCGSEERFIISSGDIYNFYFVKNEKMISMEDCGSNHFSIPFFSDIKFGLLYNPSNNFKDAIKGHIFKSVSELVASKSPPRIVRVLDALQTSDPKTSVEKNDLLIIKKIGKTILRKAFVKVYSLSAKEEKTLTDDCDSSFTTDPQSIQLYIPEILEHFPESYPLQVMMYPPGGDAEDLPPHLTTDMVTLTHTSIDSAIIATTHWDNVDNSDGNRESEEQMPISIPIEMEIEVTILQDTDEDDLYDMTKSFLMSFDLSKVKEMKVDGSKTGQEDDVKLQRYNSRRKRVREGYEFRGLDITMSDKMYGTADDLPSSVPFRSALNQPLPPTPQDLAVNPSLAPDPKTPPLPQRKPSKVNKLSKKSHTLPSNPGERLNPPVRGQSVEDSLPQLSPSARKQSSNPGSGTGPGDREQEESTYMNQLTKRFIPPVTSNSSTASPKPSPGPNLIPVLPSKSIMKKANSADSEQKKPESNDSLKALLEEFQENVQKQFKFVREEIALLANTVEQLTEKYETLQDNVNKLSRNGVNRTSSPEAPPKKLPKPGKLNSSTAPTKPQDPKIPTISLTRCINPEQQKANIENLRAMSLQEILDLLDIMKLSQYKENFSDESIDGEVLAECDETILEEELSVRNKLHRARLMKVISGKHSATSLSKGLDPYQVFNRPSS